MDDHDDAFTPLPSRKRTSWRPLDFVRRRHARFREEWCLMEASGMFGDFGTLLPLLLAALLALVALAPMAARRRLPPSAAGGAATAGVFTLARAAVVPR